MLILSIHPEFVAAIFNGTKRVEYRRRVPRQAPKGSKLAIYESSPMSALVGTAVIDCIVQTTPSTLWQMSKSIGSISHQAYTDYFTNSNRAVGIFLHSIRPLPSPISLGDIRKCWPGFHPPQQFAYLDEAEFFRKVLRTAA
jgi:predicted transcriptional regulator